MNTTQKKIIETTLQFRTNPKYPIYPPYHNGEYLEELFFKLFMESEKNYNRYYLPIFWTTVYNDNILGVGQFLNTLDPNLPYFTICQHDDAVRETLPPNTVVYSAGGNSGNVPIPLVCSKLPYHHIVEPLEKTKLVSFVGSLTHPIRNSLYSMYNNDSDFSFRVKHWTPNISDNDFQVFVNETKSSKFTLCPRGYGKTSFRLYEAIQLNSIPIYVSDSFWLPFENEIDWNKLCILIKSNELHELKNKILSITDQEYNEMLTYGKIIWEKYFEINSMITYLQKIID